MKRFLIASLTACSLLASTGAFAKENLRISYVKAPFNLQMMVMKEQDLLQKELDKINMQAQWLEITSGAKQAQALASGDLDIGGVMNTTSTIIANSEGNPVKVIAGVARPLDVFAIVGAKNGPDSIKALKGKTIAGPKGTTLHQLLVAALAKEGMSMKDVQFLQMDIAQAYAAMQSGRVDAALLAANSVIHAEKEGAKVITTANGYVTPILVITSSDKFIKVNPQAVKAVVTAHDHAWEWIQANPEEAIALGAKIQNISVEEAQKLYDWSYFTQRLQASDIESLEQDMQFMLDHQMIRNRIDVKSMILPEAFQQ